MTTRYRIDPERCRFTVQAFVTGMLRFLGHSPTFAVRDPTGELTFDGERVTNMHWEARADSLELLDRVSAADRSEIEGRMRREVLDTETFPTISFQSDEVTTDSPAPRQYRLRIAGRLTLHGVTRPYTCDVDLRAFDDGVLFQGETSLAMSEFHIQPVTALGGSVRLKDDLQVKFEIVGVPEGGP